MATERSVARILLALLLALALGGALAGAARADALDDEVRQIAEQLRCPVCQGETVADSQAPISVQMRGIIREKLQQGETRDQIIQYFVDRYGEAILTQPPKHGLNLLVWVLPLAGILAGLGILATALWARRPAPVATAPPPEPSLSAEDEHLLAEALEGRR